MRWSSPFPPRESTIKHCQKVLQVDRELGLLNFVHKQRSTFRVEDNLKAIAIEKEMLNKPVGKLGPVGGAAGALIGIHLLFQTLRNIINPPQKQRQQFST